jgi:hypothetical protein
MMAEQNGERVITVGRRGRRKFRYDDDGAAAVELDVIEVNDAWMQIDREYRDGKTGAVAPERLPEMYDSARVFCAELLKLPKTGEGSPSTADALHFLKLVTDEANALRPFFEPATPDEQSSRPRIELDFST